MMYAMARPQFTIKESFVLSYEFSNIEAMIR